MEIKGTEKSLRPPSKGEGRKNFCRPEDVSGLQYRKDVGHPGQFPFTRGIHPDMYRGRLWTMRQYAGYGTARESNRRFRYLLAQGTTGLSVAFDLPTQIGLDSDHGLAIGEVGRAGVAIDSLADMEELLEGVPLTRVSTSMTINATAAVLLASYLAVATAQKADWRKLRGTIQNDILKEYLARGTYVLPARSLTADSHRHTVLLPQGSPLLEPDFDKRIPHPGSWLDSRAGIGLYPGQRRNLCPGRRRRRALGR